MGSIVINSRHFWRDGAWRTQSSVQDIPRVIGDSTLSVEGMSRPVIPRFKPKCDPRSWTNRGRVVCGTTAALGRCQSLNIISMEERTTFWDAA